MGTSDLNLSEVKIRYYYTYEGEAEENFWCDWSNIGSSNINYLFNRMQTPVTMQTVIWRLVLRVARGQ